jgi:hypothetical protein
MIRFIPPDEQEIRESIAKEFLKKASESCYWKEDYLDKAEKTDLPMLHDAYMENAKDYERDEHTWLEAVDIVMGKEGWDDCKEPNCDKCHCKECE